MDRNLYRRIEIMYPVLDGKLKRRLIRDLETNLQDNTQGLGVARRRRLSPLSAAGGRRRGLRADRPATRTFRILLMADTEFHSHGLEPGPAPARGPRG